MNEPKISKAMAYLDDDLISDAVKYPPQKAKRPVWAKWTAMAACLCLLVVGGLTLPSWLNHLQNGKGSTSVAPTVIMNNAEYTICGAAVEAIILQECGLPTELTSDLAGTFIAYLNYDGECYYTITDEKTDVLLYEYKTEPNTNVYIVLIDGTYFAAIRRDSKGFHGINGNHMAVPFEST